MVLVVFELNKLKQLKYFIEGIFKQNKKLIQGTFSSKFKTW